MTEVTLKATIERDGGDVSTEEALKQSVKDLADLKFALDESAIVAITDQRGIINYVNQKFCEISKYSRQELLGQDHRIINSGYHPKEFMRELWTTIANGSIWRGEIKNRAKDGSYYWVDTTIVPFLTSEGKPYQYVAIRSDITDRKCAEEQIREQAALLDKAQDAILVRDLDDRILFWNHGAERIYGWTPEEAIGQNARELLFGENLSQYDKARQILDESGEWSGELHQVSKMGEELIVESRWSLVRSDDGVPKSVLVINTNITERTKLEAQFLRAQRMESIGTLAGGIAHDLNNILTPILMGVEMLRLKCAGTESGAWLNLLEQNAERGASMVRQVLSFARGLDGERVSLQPRHLVKEIIKILRETLPKSVEIEFEIPQDLWIISADATQIHQVLMNLCVNARDAMPEGGTLTVRADNVVLDADFARLHIDARPGRFVMISVADTGLGMPANVVSRIFEPFFTTKEMGKGTGLGLSTALTIVRSHGGFINVYSEPGRGTQFVSYFPAVELSEDSHADDGRRELLSGHGELILVVDDEAAIREVTRGTLEAFGYEVLTASDGTEAVALFAENRDRVQLVLTDMMMPFMDGVATIRALQKMDANVRIIAASGLAANEKAAEAATLGVRMFLPKPYTAETLLTMIAETLRSA